MLHYVFLGLFIASAISVGILLYKKVPALSAIPRESLLDQEPFRLFIVRMIRIILRVINPKRIVMHVLTWTAQALNAMRIFFLNIYHIIEALTKKVRHTSQKMQWEHQWYSEKEIRKHAPTESSQSAQDSVDVAQAEKKEEKSDVTS